MNADSRVPVGVDGCPDGWLAVVGRPPQCSASIHPDFGSILQTYPEAVIVVDIPIGLMDGKEGRAVDRLMRKRLGKRHSSVFTPPSRAASHALTYDDAKRRNIEITGKSLSKQTWGLVPKIRELDSLMTKTPALQENTREGHPEFAFAMLNDSPIAHSKKTACGIFKRTALLRAIGYDIEHIATYLHSHAGAKADDLVDACVLHHVASCILKHTAESLPTNAERDPHNLLMQVWSGPGPSSIK